MLSIIVVSYNTRELLRQCLRSLSVHCPAAEVIVIDNASEDGSGKMVRREHPAAKLIALNKNVGFAAANNIGLQSARGEFILLLNSDTYVEDDSLQRCLTWMETHPGVGAASPRLIGFDGQNQPCARPFPSFRDKLRVALWLPAKGAHHAEEASGWLIGAALMLRREALHGLDGFLDTGYFMYWEDTDLSARLLRAGWKLAVFGQGHVRHRGRASSSGKDGNLRLDLYACFEQGKYRWLSRNRTRWECAGIWMLDAVEVFRKFFRGTLLQRRRAECRQARTLANVLLTHAIRWATRCSAQCEPMSSPVGKGSAHKSVPSTERRSAPLAARSTVNSFGRI
jgi:N-acetylglucosaminyl-diphospho-decaprenol L-rhamnosyltransferase